MNFRRAIIPASMAAMALMAASPEQRAGKDQSQPQTGAPPAPSGSESRQVRRARERAEAKRGQK